MDNLKEANFEKHLSNEKCPAKQILSTIGDKWSILILILLDTKGTIRFNELAKYLGDISSKVLSQTLKSLENDGLVNRTVYPEVPPRVEYNLTELSKTLLPHILSLSDWALENMDEIYRNRVNSGNYSE
ncbi:helix-turn-helix domain-containing protein [Dysgonomonas sp. BGC7]|uniref:winged helix-turn-helix transcriptional regulator n=1 Tax=Dysgonomonas sp. BGC7 TaxID=1658008 RepID=UPI00068261E0|nr:helix-turn-helix domain-containing protein [Dysgonomonas sp. BGC7]MBD8388624.1 helix-turn-helix transcriptional regulator [Dysgonomonas sp. BGC7]